MPHRSITSPSGAASAIKRPCCFQHGQYPRGSHIMRSNNPPDTKGDEPCVRRMMPESSPGRNKES
ncbi:hypothetical protein D9623_32050 [Azospirillum brasilense]|uniref:Uncharacterized protein n=1 Tax=Azospirillum brasilense TaxID=192 RepID=A0A4D8R7W7_AZOBR|nr:hypothetical protein D3868_30590 [Azospirillum brasilense]QEL94525.1 hypothetical protein D9621_30900 [Azospirillum brasilense]QEM01013.1 hypothetical protein D9623_32050 [Azospirillum brasilense]